jgi:hypothetical protein
VTWVKWKLISVYLDIVLTSAQDWCIVWDEHTKVSEIILGTPDGILCDVGQMDTHFGPFGDSVNMSTWFGMHIA